jgi:lysophospholipase L1-like esterase
MSLDFSESIAIKKTNMNKSLGNMVISFIEAKSMKKKTKLIALAITIVILLSPFAVAKIINLQSLKAPAASKAGPIRVACVGDSITEITGYPSTLQSMLGDNYTVRNFGSTGSTVLLNSWKPYMGQPQFVNAAAFQPDIIVIMLGTNDDLKDLEQYNESFEGDYAALISSFQQLQSNPQILIANSPPIFSNSSDLNPSYLADTIIPLTDDLANKMNLPLIDVYNSFGNHTDYFLDGVHPNSQGAALIASDVYGAINPSSDLAQTP